MDFEPVIGLEVHAELQTQSKMFCACPVVDSTQAAPNTAVCPVCAGMPGTLPVVNRKAVEYGIRVALALECQVQHTSIFARKNYFYPDLPKGYQISQYEQPLAINGRLVICTPDGDQSINVRRVHLEEDTGKLTHVEQDGRSYSLVDLNRAGVPLLEIVSEPDLHSLEAIRAYATGLRAILRYVGVNSGDMEKGVIRFEANVSIRLRGSKELGKRVEIKNLNSFRAMERAVAFEFERQSKLLAAGRDVEQETLGWDDAAGKTFSQRSKEDAHDYRYFPEPDLPPLVVSDEWVADIRKSLPELPEVKRRRFVEHYGLPEADAALLVEDKAVSEYYERVTNTSSVPARTAANWILGQLFAQMNDDGSSIESINVSPEALAELIQMVVEGEINQNTGKTVLAEMFATGKRAGDIVSERSLKQVSDLDFIAKLINEVLIENPNEVASFKAGKTMVVNWLFGQVMKKAQGKANPQVVREELEKQLNR
jgi:aspartyl-tRNA(Asn)/glutamyl-tRNA(Gln) amidotransferase subunit B